ncbi:hypothetical protein [Glycomyces terrestris]|uniref:Uncharacterized protein n=1 Tax=Glycomyces terrestris TaxID=2493553 RepID=A0A426UYI1_9ACTN|nr:hypothetical protein [Glycomyces terrestris]RRR99625.1 hypothetical protein EIW28_13115 [Glycomyces terrestris]
MGRHTTKLGQQSRAQTRPPLPYPVNDGRVAPAIQEAMDRRAQRRRSRLAALSAAAVLAAGGAAGMSMATAEEPEAGTGSEIVFSGDCGTLGLLSASSIPDASELTVEEGSQVRYTNRLGANAELHVGDEVYDISDGSTQVFEMNRSAEVAMVPQCHGLFAEYDSAQVHVVEAQADDQPGEHESGSGPDEHELPAPDGDEGGDTSADGAPAGDDAAAQQGPDAEAPAEDEAEAPVEDDVNAFGEPGLDDGAGFDPAAEEDVVAVDPKAVADGANGLLALVAIICLVGVAAAVTRTLLKQRATA